MKTCICLRYNMLQTDNIFSFTTCREILKIIFSINKNIRYVQQLTAMNAVIYLFNLFVLEMFKKQVFKKELQK